MSETRKPEESYRAEWVLVFLTESLDPAASAGVSAGYRFHIDDSTARLRIADGHATDSAAPADADLRSDSATVAAIAGGRTTIADAIADGRLRADGDPGALGKLLPLVRPTTTGARAPGDCVD
jgi:hypothetical protein